MKARTIATLSVLALATAFAPLTAQPASAATTSYDLMTRQTDSQAAGEFDGRLRMYVADNGIVSGNFQESDGRLLQVSGGLTGQKIWLQLGDHGFPFTGTFVDGKLLATKQGRGLHTLTLEGSPRTHY
jgi:hypothetical protein